MKQASNKGTRKGLQLVMHTTFEAKDTPVGDKEQNDDKDKTRIPKSDQLVSFVKMCLRLL